MKNTAIFVDVQNIYYTTRQAYQRQFNYRRFWQEINTDNRIVQANAYAIASNDDGQHRFQKALTSIGFNVKLKPFIQRQDGTAKGDWDVGITLDAIDAAPSVDKVVLLSGDGDFSLLLDCLRDKYNVESHVYGVPDLTARSLIQSCDQFSEINTRLLQG